MASRKEYLYQIKGTRLSLVEKDFSTTDGLNFPGVDGSPYGTAGDGITDDIPSGSSAYKSPLTSVTAGIEVEYVYNAVSSLVDEGDSIDLPSYLAKALVYYVKGRIAEDVMDLERKEYFMREFRRMVEKHGNSQVPGPRTVMPGSHAIR